MNDEQVIAVISEHGSSERIIFAARRGNVEQPIELRRESFSPDVGWFAQSRILMTRQEMISLRSAIGGSVPTGCQQTRLRAAANQHETELVESCQSETPHILAFDSTQTRTASIA